MLTVRSVNGRYPYPAVLKQENVVAEVREEGGLIRVRIDDSRYPDTWLEIEIEMQASEK
jgi:hypothetical protein